LPSLAGGHSVCAAVGWDGVAEVSDPRALLKRVYEHWYELANCTGRVRIR
jgi:hypothetical protein